MCLNDYSLPVHTTRKMPDQYYALTSIEKPSGLIRKLNGEIPELLDLKTLEFYPDTELYRYFFAANAEVTELEDVTKEKAHEIIANFRKNGTPFRSPEEEDSGVPEGEVKEINFYE